MKNDEKDWKAQLTPEQYEVLRLKGTDAPFTGKFVDHHENGNYVCAACGKVLFNSGTKYDSHCGWPSFWDMATVGVVELHKDTSAGMVRTEVTCANCGGHLGHVFDDGPREHGGQRYCINSTSLSFTPKDK